MDTCSVWSEGTDKTGKVVGEAIRGRPGHAAGPRTRPTPPDDMVLPRSVLSLQVQGRRTAE